MSTTKIIQVFVALAGLMALWFFLDSTRKWVPGVKDVGEFSIGDSKVKVLDVKSGNRACLVFQWRPVGAPQDQLFFSCPQER